MVVVGGRGVLVLQERHTQGVYMGRNIVASTLLLCVWISTLRAQGGHLTKLGCALVERELPV